MTPGPYPAVKKFQSKTHFILNKGGVFVVVVVLVCLGFFLFVFVFANPLDYLNGTANGTWEELGVTTPQYQGR